MANPQRKARLGRLVGFKSVRRGRGDEDSHSCHDHTPTVPTAFQVLPQSEPALKTLG